MNCASLQPQSDPVSEPERSDWKMETRNPEAIYLCVFRHRTSRWAPVASNLNAETVSSAADSIPASNTAELADSQRQPQSHFEYPTAIAEIRQAMVAKVAQSSRLDFDGKTKIAFDILHYSFQERVENLLGQFGPDEIENYDVFTNPI